MYYLEKLTVSSSVYLHSKNFEEDVTKTRNGEPGTGNREQGSGNERSAVFHIEFQNGG